MNKENLISESVFKKTCLSLIIASALSSANVFADAVWVQQVQGGEIRFYDWGYTGTGDRAANDFTSINGFNGATQVQRVVTTGPDGLTPDEHNIFKQDLSSAFDYPAANMDSQVNFFEWGYTTVAGSTFNNMQIDVDGDYLVRREDMDFAFYDTLELTTSSAPAPEDYNTVDTFVNFQPYALSDATGWCGSVMASNPGALEAMAGQVSFDFGFEAFFPWSVTPGVPGTGAMQIVQDFEMRSYGSLEISTTIADGGTGDFNFTSDAVVNNTNPLDSTILTDANGDPVMVEVPVYNMDGSVALDENGNPRTMMMPKKEVGGGGVDEDFYNQVSFMGGGVVPEGVWIKVEDPDGPISNDNILEVLDADDGEDNTLWHANGFAGYPFLLRADGIRIVDALDFSLYSDLTGIPASSFDESGKLINLEGNVVQDLSVSAVPVPAAVWLFGSGLLSLIAVARRRRI